MIKMKTGIILTLGAALILILASCSSVVGTNEKNNEKIDEILESFEENKLNSKWFPGFFIVQLIKGIMALILTILILLDMIEPE